MAAHLRFDSKTGRVEARTPNGKHTEELLQLNDEAKVQYRLNTLKIIDVLTVEIKQLERQLKVLFEKLRSGEITQNEYDIAEQSIHQELAILNHIIQTQTGQLSLTPLPKKRFGVSLIK
jgi:hypothetical protein